MAQWKIVFFIAAGVYVFCATFYNIFGSGERQPWDNPATDDLDPTTTVPINGTAANGGAITNGGGSGDGPTNGVNGVQHVNETRT